ncbi:MAG: hypothetical protein KDA93_10900 [Planctomycetaceae bacterium]|nr:hypothetical protein [Planctomycetaceae bacterium]
MNPILALDLGSLFAIGFLLISFIGWIMNLINAQNPPPQPNRPARKPAPRDRKVQNEIEEFLQEAMGRRAPKQQSDPILGSEDIEIIEPSPQRRRTPKRKPLRQQPASRQQQPAAPPSSQPRKRKRPGEGISLRHIQASEDLGAGVRSHADEHMQARMSQRVEQDLPHLVNQGVSQHLGEFTADDRDTRAGVAPVVSSRAAVKDATGLIASLRDPAGMRKAIILQEILSKPRALRQHHD